MSGTAAPIRAPRPLTGRMVLACFVAFFGLVFAMNAFMIRVAVSSFSGVETESAYKAGLSFKNDVAAAQAQDARHWDVEAALEGGGNGTRIILMARDAQARPIPGLVPQVRLAHPTDKRRDVPAEFAEVEPGHFRSLTPLPQGRWDLLIELKRDAATLFRSKSRIAL